MAKYTITHSCGHDQEHSILGTNAKGQRDRKKQWLSEGVCTDCYNAEQAEKMADATASAKESNSALPRLEGSEKQIAWAETIRAKVVIELKTITDYIASTRANATPDQAIKLDKGLAIIAETLTKSSSRYWIDNRDVTFDGRWLTRQI